jgi:hypothetical protein
VFWGPMAYAMIGGIIIARDGVRTVYTGLRHTLANQGCCSRGSPAGR